jgi:hypothetical protein
MDHHSRESSKAHRQSTHLTIILPSWAIPLSDLWDIWLRLNFRGWASRRSGQCPIKEEDRLKGNPMSMIIPQTR